ncbi:unnamed protein product [Adineta ricciae]|uniref:Uncharacterized protein n=1 Tax=Adineta ricciae TaxID=249248 RepID=A0A813YJI7_ADIRI|nr:unnamed protein product [Adineta ricciae]
MFVDFLRIIFNKNFLFSICLHILYGFVFEKSKLYFPYTFGRNILLIKTDIYKFYISISFISLGVPYVLSKLLPNKYLSARSHISDRYQSRSILEANVGGYLSGVSMLLTGFCPSYLPIYLTINPRLFLYSIIASYIAFSCYQFYYTAFLHRLRPKFDNNERKTPEPVSKDQETLHNIERIIILALCVILLIVLETIEQSLPPGHSADELHDLIHNGDYLPPGLTGVICGLILTLLVFICSEYETLSSEWLMNISSYTTGLPHRMTRVTGRMCLEQTLKVLSIAYGARLSLWLSSAQEVPNIDRLFYSLVTIGSFLSALSICLTTATFTDHIYLTNAFIGNITSEIVPITIISAWTIIYLTQLLDITNLK